MQDDTYPFDEQKALLASLGDRALLIRFDDHLEIKSNQQAIWAAKVIEQAQIIGVVEVCPTLVSVLVRYDPDKTEFMALCNMIRIALASISGQQKSKTRHYKIEVVYGGKQGPDIENVATACKLSVAQFIKAHNLAHLRVLTTGFAPGFVYCGLHNPNLNIPRRVELHAMVAPGSILFAAGQTAITATHVPTGWHVIGHTDFVNFRQTETPPTKFQAGDSVSFFGELSSE